MVSFRVCLDQCVLQEEEDKALPSFVIGPYGYLELTLANQMN